MSGSPNGQVLDHYLHTQYEVIRVVYDNLDAIQKVASHLTPVEDLVDFREEVTALYLKLGVLTTASELILSVSDAGMELIRAQDAAAQRLLLELKSAALHEADYFATAVGLGAANAAINTLNTQMTAVMADVATRATQAELQALVDEVGLIYPRLDQIDLQVGGHGAQLGSLSDEVSGLTAVTVDVDSRLTSVTEQVVGHGSAINGLTTRVVSTEEGAALTIGRVSSLETELTNLKTGQTANTTAVQNLTSHTEIMDGDILTQGQLITELSSRITGVEGENDAAALAIQDLTTTVTNQGALLSTTSEANTQLTARVTDTETGLSDTANALSSLTTEVTQLGSDLTIASEDIVALKSEITSPGNVLPNPSFEADTAGWTIFNRGAGWATTQLGRNLDAATMLPLSMNALSVYEPTQPSGALGIKSDNLAVRGTQRYILSGWLAALNCTATLEWRLLDQLGQIIQFGSIGDAKLDGGETDINLWPRLWGEIPANADARELQVQLWIQTVTGPGPKLWLLRPMLEEVSGLQEGPSPWVSGVSGLAQSTAEALSSLTTRIESNEEGLQVQSEDLTSLSASLTIEIQNRQAAVAAAQGRINNILSDSIISQAEKPQLILDFKVLLNERSGLQLEATESEVDLTAYNTALDALINYMYSLNNPVPWDNLSDITYIT